MTEIKEHPILFSGEMVRAILDGRKTQTRRIMTRRNSAPDGTNWNAEMWASLDFDSPDVRIDGTPQDGEYLHVPRLETNTVHRVWPTWSVGDRLWVRETWQVCDSSGGIDEPLEAGYPLDYIPREPTGCLFYAADGGDGPWRPSIHMPRWASRILLEITAIRVQRVQEISLGDICAEGLADSVYDFKPADAGFDAWRSLWDKINAKRGHGWDKNDWVWAYTFKLLEAK